MIRRASAFLCLLMLASSEGVAADDCLPLTGSSIEILAERWSLDADQVTWLRTKLAAGELRDPSSLETMAGAGPALRESLAESFCWSAPARVRVVAGLCFREHRDEERWSVSGEKEDWVVVGRLHRDRSQDEFLKRGGARIMRGGWSLAVGTLENRQGLGLSVQTPGTLPRGFAPRRRATASWTPAPVLDSGVLMGAALGCRGGLWNASFAAVRPVGEEHQGCLSLEVGRSQNAGGLACHLTRARTAGVVSAIAWGAKGAGTWGAEAARSDRGTALGGTFGLGLGAWTVRGSLVWTGAGYASPLVSGADTPLADGGASAALETRWSGGRGRFIRLLHAVDRRPSKFESAPVSTSLVDELEWVEPIRPGLAAAFLWRLRHSQSEAAPASLDENQAGQAELRWTHAGFSARLRLEERLDGAGMSAWHVVAGNPRGRLSWEIRAGHARGEPGATAVPIYFRRAGDWSGSTTIMNGTAVGMWLRARSGKWNVELSGDGGARRWTWSVALARTVGGRP